MMALSDITEYSVSVGTTNVESLAFRKCRRLLSVELPKELLVIGDVLVTPGVSECEKRIKNMALKQRLRLIHLQLTLLAVIGNQSAAVSKLVPMVRFLFSLHGLMICLRSQVHTNAFIISIGWLRPSAPSVIQRRFCFAELTEHLKMKKKSKLSFCISLVFFVTLASPKLLRLGKAQINLAFHSTFRNFASKKGN